MRVPGLSPESAGGGPWGQGRRQPPRSLAGGPLVRSGESSTSALAPQAPAFCVGARRAAAGAHGRDAATPPAGAPQHRRLGSGVQTRDSVAAKSSLRRPETDVS